MSKKWETVQTEGLKKPIGTSVYSHSTVAMGLGDSS